MHVDDQRDPGPAHRPVRAAEPGSLGRRVADLAEVLAHGDDLGRALQAVVGAAAASLPGAQHASIAEHTPDGPRTRVASSDFALAIDRLQYGTGQGPCLTALADEPHVHVRDLSTEDRWPAFAEAAAPTGLRSTLSLRLGGTGEHVGALNLFSTVPGAFDDESLQVGTLLARHAALALVATHQVEQLQQAVVSRDVIGQAKGMLMERHGLDADRAFAVLVRYSRDTNTRLRDVAETLVTTRSLPGAG